MEKETIKNLPRFNIMGNSTYRNSAFPEEQGIYFLFDAEELVYIGRTNNLRNRLAAHCTNRLFKPSWTAGFILISNRDALKIAEKTYIKQFNPKFNFVLSYHTYYSTY